MIKYTFKNTKYTFKINNFKYQGDTVYQTLTSYPPKEHTYCYLYTRSMQRLITVQCTVYTYYLPAWNGLTGGIKINQKS